MPCILFSPPSRHNSSQFFWRVWLLAAFPIIGYCVVIATQRKVNPNYLVVSIAYGANFLIHKSGIHISISQMEFKCVLVLLLISNIFVRISDGAATGNRFTALNVLAYCSRIYLRRTYFWTTTHLSGPTLASLDFATILIQMPDFITPFFEIPMLTFSQESVAIMRRVRIILCLLLGTLQMSGVLAVETPSSTSFASTREGYITIMQLAFTPLLKDINGLHKRRMFSYEHTLFQLQYFTVLQHHFRLVVPSGSVQEYPDHFLRTFPITLLFMISLFDPAHFGDLTSMWPQLVSTHYLATCALRLVSPDSSQMQEFSGNLIWVLVTHFGMAFISLLYSTFRFPPLLRLAYQSHLLSSYGHFFKFFKPSENLFLRAQPSHRPVVLNTRKVSSPRNPGEWRLDWVGSYGHQVLTVGCWKYEIRRADLQLQVPTNTIPHAVTSRWLPVPKEPLKLAFKCTQRDKNFEVTSDSEFERHIIGWTTLSPETIIEMGQRIFVENFDDHNYHKVLNNCGHFVGLLAKESIEVKDVRFYFLLNSEREMMMRKFWFFSVAHHMSLTQMATVVPVTSIVIGVILYGHWLLRFYWLGGRLTEIWYLA